MTLLAELLRETRRFLDPLETRDVVSREFDKIINCNTIAAGASVYASDTEQKYVCFTCKSRACPTCGYLATSKWQEELMHSLPDTRYTGLVLTMPGSLWPVFQKNRHLLHRLPAIGAHVLKTHVLNTFGVEVMMIIVPHTFGGYLNFNCHLHVLMSAGGLSKKDSRWTPPFHFTKQDRVKLTELWHDTVILAIQRELSSGRLSHSRPLRNLQQVLEREANRPWRTTYVREAMTKKHFLGYAARYARRLPIAQNRITVRANYVEYRVFDKKLKKEVIERCSKIEFVKRLAAHVHDPGKHAIRYFGLISPRSKNQKLAYILGLLNQRSRSRPRKLTWRQRIKQCFGRDPLLDKNNREMLFQRSVAPRSRQLQT